MDLLWVEWLIRICMIFHLLADWDNVIVFIDSIGCINSLFYIVILCLIIIIDSIPFFFLSLFDKISSWNGYPYFYRWLHNLWLVVRGISRSDVIFSHNWSQMCILVSLTDLSVKILEFCRILYYLSKRVGEIFIKVRQIFSSDWWYCTIFKLTSWDLILRKIIQSLSAS